MPESTTATRPQPRWRARVRGGLVAGALLATLPAALYAQKSGSHGPRPWLPSLVGADSASLPWAPAAVADSAALEAAITSRFAHGPLARVLAERTKQPALAKRIAQAIVREAERIRVAPSLLAGILLTENDRLNSRAVGKHGAMGLMQIMPFHAGKHGCASKDLQQIEANICHGASIFNGYFKRTGRVPEALTRYNGCRGGTERPRCRRYLDKVLGNASRVRTGVLRTAAERAPAATSATPGS